MLSTLLMVTLMNTPALGAEPAPPVTVHADTDGRWTVEAVREYGGRSATGAVTFSADAPPDPAATPHAAAGGARAWLALGTLLADSPADAIACAERGLEELGSDYTDRSTRDDTSLKITLARSMAAEQPADAAATLLRMLSDRLSMYQDFRGVDLSAP